MNQRTVSGGALADVCGGDLPEEEALNRVNALLSSGADPNAAGVPAPAREGMPLHLAASKGYARVVECLLQAGANPVAKGTWTRFPLDNVVYGDKKSDAEREACLRIAKMLFAGSPQVAADLNTPRIFPVLAIAANTGFVPMVRLLLSHGANPNILQAQQGTLFYHALAPTGGWGDPVRHEQAREAFGLLLDAGADVNAATDWGNTPLNHLITGNTPLMLVELLIERGADVHRMSRVGSPLAMATACHRTDIVECLLARGADPLAAQPGGKSALDCAVGYDLPLLETLLAATDPDDIARQTHLFDVALRDDQAGSLRLLAAHGWVINPTVSPGKPTLLHRAARRGALQVVTLLLEAGNDPRAADRFGSTPQHVAARFGRVAVLELLLAASPADPVDNNGRTPLHIAALYNRAEAITVLLAHGAKAANTDKNGDTPLDLARKRNNKRALAVL